MDKVKGESLSDVVRATWFERCSESIVAEDMSVLEETIFQCGWLPPPEGREEMLMRQGQGFGTATAPRQPTKPLPYICPNPRCGNRFAQAMRTKCILCHRDVLTVKESSCVLRSPAADGSSWELVEGAWTNKSGSFQEDFKHKFGVASAPPDEMEPVAAAHEDRLESGGEVPRVSARVKALRDEAVSKEHELFHFPKNLFRDTCNQAKLLVRRVGRKPRPDHEPNARNASCFGEVIAADRIHVYRSPDSCSAPAREYVVLCVRDKFTGLLAAFPGTDCSTDSVVTALRKIVGRKIASRTVSLLSDAADTFEAAAKMLGWIHCPSLPNRFPHNTQMEREIPSFEEGVCSVFLNAGFAIRPQVWLAACKYGAMALNLTATSPQDKSLTRWDFAVAHLGYDDVPPIKCVLGQLVFIRSKIGDKFAPNAARGLFAGWRLEPGCSIRELVLC